MWQPKPDGWRLAEIVLGLLAIIAGGCLWLLGKKDEWPTPM